MDPSQLFLCTPLLIRSGGRRERRQALPVESHVVSFLLLFFPLPPLDSHIDPPDFDGHLDPHGVGSSGKWLVFSWTIFSTFLNFGTALLVLRPGFSCEGTPPKNCSAALLPFYFLPRGMRPHQLRCQSAIVGAVLVVFL